MLKDHPEDKISACAFTNFKKHISVSGFYIIWFFDCLRQIRLSNTKNALVLLLGAASNIERKEMTANILL